MLPIKYKKIYIVLEAVKINNHVLNYVLSNLCVDSEILLVFINHYDLASI